MRLLDVDTYQFVFLHDPRQRVRVGEKVDHYAILSHTWNEGQEPSYQDWQVWLRREPGFEEIQERSGFKKITQTCYMAKKMGYSRVWIDTICIDKSSSAELSEAINSMFAFYTHAAVCLAFLSDVDAADGSKGFQKSRWFTRGWTLQELLAPDDVQFFDRKWQPLGSKTQPGLIELISTTTGISKPYLRKDGPLSLASISDRMSWAAKRQTTRIEDESYCLLGIFDINMPLLYGEADKAFLRLQEEILKVSTDHTIFAWSWPHDLSHSLTGTSDEMNSSWVTILAPNIRCFAGTGSNYEPLGRDQDDDVAGNIYSMTNCGLQIRLPLIHTCSNRSYAPLMISRSDQWAHEVICVPVAKISGTYMRCGWPERPVTFPRSVLQSQLRYGNNIFLGRRGSLQTWRSPGTHAILRGFTPQSYNKMPLQCAFQVMFCKPGNYKFARVALTKGAKFEDEYSILQISHDDDVEEPPSFETGDTFKGAVIFLRQTNVEISRLVQVLVGVRQMATGPKRTNQLHLSIARKNILDGGDATVNEVEELCQEIEDRTPSADHVQRLFAPRQSDREPTAAESPDMREAPNILKHARHRTYNAAIGEPIDALVHAHNFAPEQSVRPYPVFVWEELGSRHSRRGRCEPRQRLSDHED